ncbi:MAG: GNAT family N-acetyltransferase [Clostridiales bacterium]|jgi:predicted GNAT family acetyltransferase|nr:GNAT family N-acetyltransferase [Clostridiales bacterium]
MVVKVYDNAAEYLIDNEEALLEQEAVSQLVLYDAYKSRQSPEEIRGLFGVVIDYEHTILHFSNLPSQNLSIYIQDYSKDIRSAVRLLADYMLENHIAPKGIYGKYEVCEAFIEQYKRGTECEFAERMAMNIMEIRQVNDIKPVVGLTRLAIPNEVKQITEWMVQFQIEALAKEIDYESALVTSSKLINNNKLYVYEDAQNTVVSMAAATRKLPHGIAISYVYTPEEYRGMGYAAANIYYISKKYLAEGNEFCTLFVDKENLLSVRAYEKVGFKVLDDIYEYKLLQA